MITENENGQNHPIVNEFSVVVTVVKIVIFAIFLLPLAQYSIDMKTDGIDPNSIEVSNNTITTGSIVNVEPTVNVSEKIKADFVKRRLPAQPSCPTLDKMKILKDICEELRKTHDICTPEDKFKQDQHKIPERASVKNHLRKEAELPTIVNYALGIILIASLGAALLELYKAKMQPTKKNGKSPLSRKCSLAELTVLKHQRKEMLRRDSLMELPEENLYALGRKVSRPPLRLN
nr:uncharacterized protein LOC111516424 [Leptinotarsa decemlineata]